jgi:hypothetical protein
MLFNLPVDKVHLGILKKFQILKNQILNGRAVIVGTDSNGLPEDVLVPAPHRLHGLRRGFYKPAGWKAMLSYQATEKEDNYGQSIEWENIDEGTFKKIIMRPPNSPGDNSAKSDITAARYNLENKLPIGILHNIKKGVNRSLGIGLITEETADGNFIVVPVTLDSINNIPDNRFFTFRTNDSTFVNILLGGEINLTFESISNHYNVTKKNDIVFLVLGGDKPDWDTGLIAICKISKDPYSKGYDNNKPNYFKVGLKVELLLPRSIKREEMVPYRNTYNMTFIGPMLKGEPNQANSLADIEQVIALLRSLLDFFPELEENLIDIFGIEMIIKAKSESEIFMYKYIEDEDNIDIPGETSYELKYPYGKIPANTIDPNIYKNRIIYGAPGTGKSYYLNEQAIELFPHETLQTRVTFYNQYSYSQFVGAYKPTPIYQETEKTLYESDMVTTANKNMEPLIDYRFTPGPFIDMLCRAIKDRDHNYLLIIEEINRANVTAVFGDVFQLLDRNESGESVYSTTFSFDVMNYLRKNGINLTSIRLPSNLYIWATMNSADQGVMPLDSAFKRRWSFEYLPLDSKESVVESLEVHPKFLIAKIKWNKFRNILNEHLKTLGVAEDKLIGPFFLSEQEILDDNAFKNKLLLYLRDDILRHNPGSIFTKTTFSDIIKTYDKGNNVFKIKFEEVKDENE